METGIAERIKYARIAKKLTQPALAELCGWDSQTRISNYERGIREPSIQDLDKIAKALGVDVGWLIVGYPKSKGLLAGALNKNDAKIPEQKGFGILSAAGIAEKLNVSPDPDLFSVEEPKSKYPSTPMFTAVPRYDVELSAGHGSTIGDENSDDFLYFRKSWIERKELDENNLCVVSVKGDSMSPTINEKEVVLIDTSEYYTHRENVDDGFIYAISIDDEAMVKRLFKKPGGGIIVRSDSPAPQYKDLILEGADLEYLRIIGRAIWRAGDL